MKTILTTISLLTYIAAVSLAGDTNFLADPGFEDGLRAWQGNTAYPPEAVEVVREDPRHVRSGASAIKIVQHRTEPNGDPKFCAVYSLTAMPVEPLVEYTLRCWVKGEGAVGLSLYGYNEQGNVYEAGTMKVTKDAGDAAQPHYHLENADPWKQCTYTVVLTKPDTKVKEVRVAINSHGEVYVDDCFFGKKETPGSK
jgi:hypothetical protein